MGLRRVLAVRAAKLVGSISRKMGRQGVTWAGLVARLIYPDILQDLAGQLRGKSFIVCGTNGKTTTNNLLCSAIEAEGKKDYLQPDRLQYAERRCGRFCPLQPTAAEK